MALTQSANVRSIEAIDTFRSSVTVYASKAKPLIEDAWDEVNRTREWLRTDRRTYWENEVRRRRRQMEDAQQALFSARFSLLKQVSTAEQAAVQRARRALFEAEGKLEKVRRWLQEFDDRVGPLLKQLEEVRSASGTGMQKAAIYLNQISRALEAYTHREGEATSTPVAAQTAERPEPVASQGAKSAVAGIAKDDGAGPDQGQSVQT